jgi:dTDP-glucose pyrophosphorylase
MLQIVVPMAGRGSRFTEAGYALPKPLIDVGGRPMIDVVIDNLRPRRPHRFVFVVQAEQIRDFDLDARLRDWAPGCDVVGLDHVTQGAACTVLTTRELLDPDLPLMTANCDQWVDMDIDRYLDHFDGTGVDGFLMTMPADDPKWSYAELDERGWVTRVVEKEVISRNATVGIYNWSRAGDFLHHADAMIAADRRVNGEFYVAPVYSEQIAAGAHVEVLDVDAEGQAMWGLGTPADLTAFLSGPARDRALTPRTRVA